MIEITFALIKSRAIRHNLHALVVGKILENDFIIERAQWCSLREPAIACFYSEHKGRSYWDDLVRSVSGHVIALALSRHNAVDSWRAIMGATDPRKAAPGTLRALAIDEPVVANNIVHGSDSVASAEREIRLIFGDAIWHRINDRSPDGP